MRYRSTCAFRWDIEGSLFVDLKDVSWILKEFSLGIQKDHMQRLNMLSTKFPFSSPPPLIIELFNPHDFRHYYSAYQNKNSDKSDMITITRIFMLC